MQFSTLKQDISVKKPSNEVSHVPAESGVLEDKSSCQGQWSVRTEQILEVNTEMASEAAERFARLTGNDGRDSELAEALNMHEVEGEDVRAASGINETMGRDIAELLKLEVKS